MPETKKATNGNSPVVFKLYVSVFIGESIDDNVAVVAELRIWVDGVYVDIY